MTSVGLRIKKALKSMVRFLERVLPPPAFDRLYRSAFPVYRALVWALYLAACRLAFERREIELHQVLGVKVGEGGVAGMPLRPDWGV